MTLPKGNLSAVMVEQVRPMSCSFYAVAEPGRPDFDLVQYYPRDCLTCGLAKSVKCTEGRMITFTLGF